MSSASSQIRSTGPVPLPVSEQQAGEYLATLAAMPHNKFKNYIRDSHEPAYYIDIAALEGDLDAGKLPFKLEAWPVSGRQWDLRITGEAISQGEGGGIDLMYAASMPADRILKRLIVIDFPEGLSMIDGSHRIARALIDRRTTQPAAIVAYADIAPYRVPEAQVEASV